MADDVVWDKPIDGTHFRIVQLEEDDCLVEKKVGEDWVPTDDEEAAFVYMRAFLDLRKTVASSLDAVRMATRGVA